MKIISALPKLSSSSGSFRRVQKAIKRSVDSYCYQSLTRRNVQHTNEEYIFVTLGCFRGQLITGTSPLRSHEQAKHVDGLQSDGVPSAAFSENAFLLNLHQTDGDSLLDPSKDKNTNSWLPRQTYRFASVLQVFDSFGSAAKNMSNVRGCDPGSSEKPINIAYTTVLA